MKKFSIIMIVIFALHHVNLLAQQDAKKNILFIAIDDLKPLIKAYGYDQMHTPNIDKLASNGVVFENAHCQQAVCGPSRASLLTGMTPDYTGVWDLRTRMRNVNADILAMPEYFKEKGFETTAVGKIYDPRCVDKQYDEPSWSIPYKVSSKLNYPEEWGEPVLSYYAGKESKELGAKLKKEAIEKGENIHSYVAERYKPAVECVEAPDDAYMDGQITNNSLKYLEEFSKADKPFFLAVGFKRPHLPFAAPKKYWDLYDREQIELAPYQKPVKDGVDIAYHNHGELLSYTDIPPLTSFSDIFSELIPDNQQKELIHGYYASVSFIDAQVGKIMEKLKELGLDKNTVVVLWGDHGWHLGDHALWCKHTNFEQATRVPLIISTPNGEKGRYDHPVELLDIFPTLCDASGVEVPEHLQGTSLVPGMVNTNVPVKEFAVSQFDRGKTHGYSIRTKQYRFTVWMKEGFRTYDSFNEKLIYDCELYDYKVDALETQNLYRSKEYKEVVDQMMKHFKSYVTKQNIELQKSGSNPANKSKVSIAGQLNIDGTFDQPLDENWKKIARNGAETIFEVLPESEIGENAFHINVKKLGEKPWDAALISKSTTQLPGGKELTMSFHGRGGKIKVVLTSNKGSNVARELILGENTYVHQLNFNLQHAGLYKVKFQFMETGDYYLDGIKTEFY